MWITLRDIVMAEIPGAPLTYFNDGGSDRGSYFTPKKIPTSKIPTFFSITKKIPQCFCINKFYYQSSGKLKHANFNFGFGRSRLLLVLVKNKTIALMLFLIWADEKYNTHKNPSVVFATPKNPGVFHRPKKIPFGQNVRPKKILRTPPPPPPPPPPRH